MALCLGSWVILSRFYGRVKVTGLGSAVKATGERFRLRGGSLYSYQD